MIEDKKFKLSTPNSQLSTFQAGFTLIEILVSVSIFVVISGMMVANLRVGALRDELVLGAVNLAEAIREAQNRALSGELARVCAGQGIICPVSGCGASECVDLLPLGGYGVYLNQGSPNEYVLFADINNNSGFNKGEEIRRSKFVSSGNVNTAASGFVPSGQTMVILFRPPKPTAFINGGTANSFADIILGHRFSASTKTVHFERVSGAVGVQ